MSVQMIRKTTLTDTDSARGEENKKRAENEQATFVNGSTATSCCTTSGQLENLAHGQVFHSD